MSIEVRYQGQVVPVTPGTTVLEALERSGQSVPSSCRAGVCQTCVMRVVEGPVPPGSQDGLKEAYREQGYFLSCLGRPEASLTCEPAHVAPFRGWVDIQEIQILAPDVALVRFARPEGFAFAAGQFVSLRRDDGLTRSYSLASDAQDLATFSVHVRHVPGGRMSGWLWNQARPGDRLWAEGPKGDCFYQEGRRSEALVLVGTGTGMAPLFAIARDAMARGHEGPVTIIQGALTEDRFYLVEDLSAFASRHATVRYVRCVRQGPASASVRHGELTELLGEELGDLRTSRVYLCGDPTLVGALKRHLFLEGLSYRRIHADPFVGTDATAS